MTLINQIREIVNYYLAKINKYNYDHLDISSYADLRLALEMFELRSEVYLYNMLLRSSDTDEQGLQETFRRAHRRRKIGYAGIGYDNNPFTLTNEFYYRLACLLFEPKNCLDLIEILFLNSDKMKLIDACVPETFPAGLTTREKCSFFRTSEPNLLITHDFSSLKEYPPTLEALASLVIQEEYIFDLNRVNHYSFKRQGALYRSLKTIYHTYPPIANKVYSHNIHWQSLANDLKMVEKAGLSPREAIQALISGLRRGGTSQTSDHRNASEPALVAITKFVTQFEAYPEGLREQLLGLKDDHGRKGLADFFTKLGQYHCVELLVKGLDSLLMNNPVCPVLDENPGISNEVLKHIEKRCRLGIETQKDKLHLTQLPSQLTSRVISALNITDLNSDDNCARFAALPNELYWALFQYGAFSNRGEMLKKISTLASSGFLSREKIIVILSVLLENETWHPELKHFSYHIFEQYFEANPTIASEVCRRIPSYRLYQILSESRYGQPWLSPILLSLSLRAIRCYLSYLTQDEIIDLLLIRVENSRPLYFVLALRFTPAFFAIMNALPSEVRKKVLDERSDNGRTYLMGMLMQGIECYHTIKQWYTADEFAEELRKCDNEGRTLLHFAAALTEKDGVGTLLAFLHDLPPTERRSRLFLRDKNQRAPLGCIQSWIHLLTVVHQPGLVFQDGSHGFKMGDLLPKLLSLSNELSKNDIQYLTCVIGERLIMSANSLIRCGILKVDIETDRTFDLSVSVNELSDEFLPLKMFVNAVLDARSFQDLIEAIRAFRLSDQRFKSHTILYEFQFDDVPTQLPTIKR